MQPYVWCKRARGRGGLSNLPPVATVPTGRRGFHRGELGGDGVDLDVLERVQLFPAGDGQVVKHLFGGRAGARWDGGRRLRSSLSECWGGEVDPMGGGARAGASEVDPMGGDARAGGGEADPKGRRRECWCSVFCVYLEGLFDTHRYLTLLGYFTSKYHQILRNTFGGIQTPHLGEIATKPLRVRGRGAAGERGS